MALRSALRVSASQRILPAQLGSCMLLQESESIELGFFEPRQGLDPGPLVWWGTGLLRSRRWSPNTTLWSLHQLRLAQASPRWLSRRLAKALDKAYSCLVDQAFGSLELSSLNKAIKPDESSDMAGSCRESETSSMRTGHTRLSITGFRKLKRSQGDDLTWMSLSRPLSRTLPRLVGNLC